MLDEPLSDTCLALLHLLGRVNSHLYLPHSEVRRISLPINSYIKRADTHSLRVDSIHLALPAFFYPTSTQAVEKSARISENTCVGVKGFLAAAQ